ncbi:MAG: RNA 2',3'-cyclic phosphodiesterase [Defluviitaleaceae bacterium]|nr:RNA 2',3'-cyclic phosphodiesterase [Defluviitaleaceae bacterium]
MRLFIAINFDKATRDGLVLLQNDLRKQSTGGNFTLYTNLHLTLAFIGECTAAQANTIKTVIDSVNFTPFPIKINSIGRFGRKEGDLWWAGIAENKALLALQHNITQKLITAGFTLDTRKYNPHITLGRKIITAAASQQIEPLHQSIASIDLMKSEHIQGLLTYTTIHTKGATT